MREALERAKHELAIPRRLPSRRPEAPDETFEVDVSNTVAWITQALNALTR